MKVKVVVELDIDEKQYDETYEDLFHPVDSSLMKCIRTEASTKKMIHNMEQDIKASAQNGIIQWAKALSFNVNIKNRIYEY